MLLETVLFTIIVESLVYLGVTLEHMKYFERSCGVEAGGGLVEEE